jgi:hypothetical protein
VTREQVTVHSIGAVDRGAEPPLLSIVTAYGEFEWPSDGRVLRPLHGFTFAARAEVVGHDYDEPAQLWDLTPRQWHGLDIPAQTLKILRMAEDSPRRCHAG